MKGRFALALALLLGAAPPPAIAQQQIANIFGNDDRESHARDRDSPYGAVGAIQWIIDGAWAGRGTATLVSPCHVLTAHHIAFKSDRGPGEPRSFAYGPPRGKEPFGNRVRAFALIWGDKRRHFHDDWALLRLEPCLDDGHPWWRPLALKAEEAKNLPGGVMMAGYPVDRALDTLSIDPSCRVLGRDQQVPPAWLHDCATRIGDSGGALFHMGSDGRPRLLAIVHAEGTRRTDVLPRWTRDDSNYAVPVANFIDRIRPYLGTAN